MGVLPPVCLAAIALQTVWLAPGVWVGTALSPLWIWCKTSSRKLVFPSSCEVKSPGRGCPTSHAARGLETLELGPTDYGSAVFILEWDWSVMVLFGWVWWG
jgi:hypothetical protein